MTMGFYVPTNKDVKFPKACEQCYFYDGLLCCVLDTYIHDPENKHGECPLIEVPPHGRMIDADALHELFEYQWHHLQVLNWNGNPTAKARQSGINWCISTMRDSAPTIIPASKGASNG